MHVPGYTNDLAYIHDAGFGDFARNAAPGLLATLRRNGISSGLVVDLGCGTGIWANELVSAGYQVLGVDISPSMLRIARKRAPQARFVTASLLDCDLPRCDAVTSLGECINYSFDPANSKRELARFFRRVYEALRPGGMLIFDTAEPGQIEGAGGRRTYGEAEDWAVLVESHEDRKRRTLIRRITSFRRAGKLYRRTEELHQLRLYPGPELAVELEKAGFRARLAPGYGSCRLPRAHVAILASKP